VLLSITCSPNTSLYIYAPSWVKSMKFTCICRFSLRCAAEPLLLAVLAIAVVVSGRLLRHRIKFSQVRDERIGILGVFFQPLSCPSATSY